MTISIVLSALILILGNGSNNSCVCRPAVADDSAHGANESIQYTAKSVREIRGNVTLPNGEPISEAVIEVYEYSVSDKKLPVYVVENSKKRKTACLTDERGEFCIPRLSAGKYLLKVGTRSAVGINNAYIIVNLIPNLDSRRKLEISLQLGT